MEICDYYLRSVLEPRNNSASWIQKMISSYSNFNKKLIYGNSYDFGDFDRCLSIKVDESGVVGKYCLIKYHSEHVIPVPPVQSLYNLKWNNVDKTFGGAVCVPSVCGSDFIKTLVTYMFNGTNLTLTTDYNQDDFCQVQKSVELSFSQNVTISILLLYVLSVLTITWTKKNQTENDSYLSSFSLITNFKALYKSRKQALNFLSHIRTVLYIGLVFFHSFFLRAYFPLANSEKMIHFIQHPFTVLISTFPLCILGFFVISSALTSRQMLKLLNNKSFSFIILTIDRYVRTMFVVVVVIILNISINNLHIYQAPYYFPDQQSEGCRKSWWSTMLLVNNYYNLGVKDMCAPQTWFLSANFHFFLLTPLVIYPMWRWRKMTFFVFPVLTLASIGTILYYVSNNRGFLKEIDFFSITNSNFSGFYLQTHYLASGWIVGMFVGWIFFKYENIEMGPFFIIPIFGCIMFVIFKIFIWSQIFEPWEILMPFDRLLASIMAGCLLFLANYSKSRNSLTKLMESELLNMCWNVVDRVGLSLYIVHPFVIIGSVVIQKHAMTFDILPIFIKFFSDFSISLVLAIVLFLFIEAPFIKLTKIILFRMAETKNSESNISV